MILAFSTTWRLVVCLNVLSAVSHALRVHYSTGMQVRRLQEHWIWQLTAELKLASTALQSCCSDSWQIRPAQPPLRCRWCSRA